LTSQQFIEYVHIARVGTAGHGLRKWLCKQSQRLSDKSTVWPCRLLFSCLIRALIRKIFGLCRTVTTFLTCVACIHPMPLRGGLQMTSLVDSRETSSRRIDCRSPIQQSKLNSFATPVLVACDRNIASLHPRWLLKVCFPAQNVSQPKVEHVHARVPDRTAVMCAVIQMARNNSNTRQHKQRITIT